MKTYQQLKVSVGPGGGSAASGWMGHLVHDAWFYRNRHSCVCVFVGVGPSTRDHTHARGHAKHVTRVSFDFSNKVRLTLHHCAVKCFFTQLLRIQSFYDLKLQNKNQKKKVTEKLKIVYTVRDFIKGFST